MDLAETLFGLAWRWAKAKRAGAATGLAVEVHDRRLLAIAGLLAERPWQRRPQRDRPLRIAVS